MKQVKIFNSMGPDELTNQINAFLESIIDTATINDIIYKVSRPYNCVMIIYTRNWNNL